MKKLLASAAIVAASLLPVGKADAVLSNCVVGRYYSGGVPVGAYSACYGPSGIQRIRVVCEIGSRVGPWVGSGKVSSSMVGGPCSTKMIGYWVQFGA